MKLNERDMRFSVERTRERYDVVVVGAGQAGLAMGYFLARQGRRFVILDGADSIGSAWRARWDSLTLFTPRRYDGLPGLPFPRDPDGYPTRDEVIDYLEEYAKTFELPVELNSRVGRLTAEGKGYRVDVNGKTLAADQIVVATGPFQTPFVPEIASGLGSGVAQMHSTGYRNASDVPEGTVLVVGGGNTGFQIAKELSATHAVHLAIGSRQTPLPQKILGRDLFWWLTKLGLITKTVDSRIGRRAQHRDVLIGSRPRELRRRYGVTLRPRVAAASGRTVNFADGTDLDVDALMWATGYRPDYSWIDVSIFGPDGRLQHRRGVAETPGLFLLGLTWQHTRGSALLGWVKDDAEFLAGRIAADAEDRLGADAVAAAHQEKPRSEPIAQGV